MSLPNQDDDDGRRPPGRTPFGSDGISPIKKLTVALDEDDEVDDEQTSAETSIGSMSFASDLTSVVAGAGAGAGGGAAGAAPQTTAAIIGNATPMSALTMETRAAHEADSNSIRSSGSNHSRLDYDESAIQERRRNNLRQLQQLGIATGVTFSMFLYLLVPTALLMSMILFGGVSAAFMARLAVYLQWEFNRSILEGRGIGDYLPQGMYEALTSSSLNDILTDPDGIFGVSEHMPYILLYMIPGLTREQRDAYVGQLSPHHQRLLRNEHGLLGYLHNRNRHLNPNNGEASSFLMRLLMGDERLRQQQQLLQMQNTRLSSSSNRLELPPTIPEGVSWGDTSHLGADDDPTSASSGLGASGTTPITTTAAAVASTIATRQENPPSSRAANSAANDIPATVSPIVGRAVVLNEAPQQAVDRSTPTPPPARAPASASASASASATVVANGNGNGNGNGLRLDDWIDAGFRCQTLESPFVWKDVSERTTNTRTTSGGTTGEQQAVGILGERFRTETSEASASDSNSNNSESDSDSDSDSNNNLYYVRRRKRRRAHNNNNNNNSSL